MGWAGGWCVQETGQAWLSEGQRENPRAWGLVSKGSVEVRAGRPAEEGECFLHVMSSAWRLEMGCGGGGEAGRLAETSSLRACFSALVQHTPPLPWVVAFVVRASGWPGE